jgi:hypothetical protein
MTDIRDEQIAKVKEECNRLKANNCDTLWRYSANEMLSLIARLEAAEAKLAKAREALKPFAWMAENNISAHDNTEAMRHTLGSDVYVLTWSKFRTAARIYKEIQE